MTSSNDLRLAEDSDRGKKALMILNNPIYQESLLAIRGELMNAFELTKSDDSKARDEIWRKLQVVGWFENHLRRVMQTGKLADETLMQKVKRTMRL